MKRTDITIQDLEKAIQSLKVEQGDGEAFNAGMYYARDFIEPYYNKLLKENERLNNIIDELEEILEREIKIGEETFPDDIDSIIVCNTLKQVLNDLNKLKEPKGSDE